MLLTRISLLCVTTLALISASTCVGASVEEASARPVGLPTLYVGKFQPVESAPSRIGPLQRVNAGMHRVKAEAKAAQLSSSLVDALHKLKISAELLPEDAAARPHVGWVIKGVYYALDQNGRLVSLPMEHENGPNVEVSVSIADCAADPYVPFAVLGTDAVMKGQGAPVGWNPYVVAAKFVFHEVQVRNTKQDEVCCRATSRVRCIFEELLVDIQEVMAGVGRSCEAGSGVDLNRIAVGVLVELRIAQVLNRIIVRVDVAEHVIERTIFEHEHDEMIDVGHCVGLLRAIFDNVRKRRASSVDHPQRSGARVD